MLAAASPQPCFRATQKRLLGDAIHVFPAGVCRSPPRCTRDTYSVLYCSTPKARRIVVTMMPGDVLEFREIGRRGRWTLPIDNAFRYAVRMQALADGAQRRRIKGRKLNRNS